jgi:RNA polymerase sigma factor (sigma-70 family)
VNVTFLSVIDETSEPAPATPRGAVREDQLALARVAAEGDKAALHSILKEIGPAMAHAARAVLGSEDRYAEDVLQESLLALVDALPSYRGECGLKHFGCRIAARAALKARRKTLRRREKLHTLLNEERQLREEVPSPARAAASEQRKELLRRLLDELPATQAEALTLRVVFGHGLGEIATMTGAPINTVRSRLRLAKEALRQRIEADPSASELFGRAS